MKFRFHLGWFLVGQLFACFGLVAVWSIWTGSYETNIFFRAIDIAVNVIGALVFFLLSLVSSVNAFYDLEHWDLQHEERVYSQSGVADSPKQSPGP